MNKTLTTLLMFLIAFSVTAQRYTISGYITDKGSGERLINANVYEANTLQGTTANNFGFYSITLPKGHLKLVSSFIGYMPQVFEFDLESNVTLNIELELQSGELDEVMVFGNQVNKVEDTQMSMIDLDVQKIQKIPVIIGEADVLKVIQLLPGVQSGTEGTSGIHVRGGSSDQNLFLLDGVPVYNASHLLGFISVFNPDAIRSVKLYKGGFPARYGGRLSSVVDISMKDGNMQKIKGDFSIGLISSKLMLEGPIIKDKTSFIISARRSYVDVLAQPFLWYINATEDDYSASGGVYFHDYNLKFNHIFSERSRLYLSGYFGKDKFYAVDKYKGSKDVDDYYNYTSGLGWGNTLASARWNYLISNKLFSNTTFTFSKYDFDVSMKDVYENKKENYYDEEYFNYNSGIKNITAKIDFDYFPTPGHEIKFGISGIRHHFTPGITQFKYENTSENGFLNDTVFGNRNVYANEIGVYFEDEIKLTNRLNINIGAHLSLFGVDDTSFVNLQPRVSLRYKASNNLAFKAAYSRMAQHVHLLSSSGIGLPTDLWVPVTKKIEPPISDQLALGAAINIASGYSLTVEGFYKTMNNLIEYKDGAMFISNSIGWEDMVEKGKGWSYGAELMLEKTLGKTTGWVGYTWSKNDRKFENLNFGNVFPARYDRRHDLSIALTHKFNDRIDIGASWIYSTGNAITLQYSEYNLAHIPGVKYYSNMSKLRNINQRNNYRMPDYHRLDVGVNFHKEKKRGTRTWSISAYNAYNRMNPFYVSYETRSQPAYSWDDDGNMVEMGRNEYTRLKKFTLLPIIPSVSYSFKF